MARLPIQGGDAGDWGDILNSFLEVSHNADGSLASNIVGTNQLQTGAVTNSQLDNATKNTLNLASSSVQTINTKTGSNITLSASDVSAVPAGEVVTPEMYGAVGDGVTNDTAAIQAAINAVVNSIGTGGTVKGRPGSTYLCTGTVSPSAGGFTLSDLRLVAAGSQRDYLMKLDQSFTNSGARHPHTDIAFRNVEFDGQHLAGGLYMSNYLRVNVTDCRFFRFSGSMGLHLDIGSDAHEAIVKGCFFSEYPWPETGTKSGIALQVDSHDNHIANCLISAAQNGLIVNASCNIFESFHIYGCMPSGGTSTTAPTSNFCVDVGVNGNYCKFSQMYIDSGCFRIQAPWHTTITDSIFLHGSSAPTYTFMVFKSTAGGQYIQGVEITNNTFLNQSTTSMAGVSTDTTTGGFSASNQTQLNIVNNDYINTTAFASKGRLTTSLSGSGQPYTVNMPSVFAGLKIQSAVASFIPNNGGGVNAAVVTALGYGQVTAQLLNGDQAGTLVVDWDTCSSTS